jgi:hypothetical protein
MAYRGEVVTYSIATDEAAIREVKAAGDITDQPKRRSRFV